MRKLTMVAIAPLRPVQILPNHHKRLAEVVEDFGPLVEDGKKFLYPGYMFISAKPPSWFWSMTGVVRCLRSYVHKSDLDKSLLAYEEIRRSLLEVPSPRDAMGAMKQAVVQLMDVDGQVIARVVMFGREMDVKVVAA